MVHLEIPPRSAYVGVVRLAIASLAREAELDEESVDDLKIAVSEACANAVLSNEETGTDDPVTISWDDRGDSVVIEVGDRGRIYDASDASDLDSQGFASRLVMSLGLLRSLVDRCDFFPRPGGGMLTRLILAR